MANYSLQVRVNKELEEYYRGDTDKIKEALLLYMRASEGFIKEYVKVVAK